MKLCLCIPLIHSLSSSRSVIFIYSVSVFPREVPSHLISHQHLAHCVRRVYLMSEHVDSSFSLLKTYPTFCQEEDSTCVLVSCLKVLIALIFIGCISVRLLLGPGVSYHPDPGGWHLYRSPQKPAISGSCSLAMPLPHWFLTFFLRQAFCFQTLLSGFSSSELFSGFILRLLTFVTSLHLLLIIVFVSVCMSAHPAPPPSPKYFKFWKSKVYRFGTFHSAL